MNMETRILVSDLSAAQRHAAVAEEWEHTRHHVDPFAEEELALRRERLERAETKEVQELELRRRVEQDRRAIREQAAREASKRFQSDRGGYRKRIETAQSSETHTASTRYGSQTDENAMFEVGVEPVSAFRDHPYRLYFNWPALREDRVTGKAD
jgi:hypothetical protein